MHEEGIQRLRGAIEERKEFVSKINDLQKQLEADEIDIYGFYEGIIAIKDSYETGLI
jgi:hypothetical protein